MLADTSYLGSHSYSISKGTRRSAWLITTNGVSWQRHKEMWRKTILTPPSLHSLFETWDMHLPQEDLVIQTSSMSRWCGSMFVSRTIFFLKKYLVGPIYSTPTGQRSRLFAWRAAEGPHVQPRQVCIRLSYCTHPSVDSKAWHKKQESRNFMPRWLLVHRE